MAAALVCVVGCGPTSREVVRRPLQERERRRSELVDGIRGRVADPIRAAAAFRRAGPGPELERLRMELWFGCLERGDATARDWFDYVESRPPSELLDLAQLRLVAALQAEGRLDEARERAAGMSPERRAEAEALLLANVEESERLRVARRLAVVAPAMLRATDETLEAGVLPLLTTNERLRRAVRWREAGHPRRSAAELRSMRLRGDAESQRRLELAHSELAAGSPTRAIAALPALSRCGRDEAVVLAKSWRARAWSRFPRGSSARAFRECFLAARHAVSRSRELDPDALELVLECGTEGGRLEAAFDAWRELAGAGWSGQRRGWLGRRLGLAMIRAGSGAEHDWRRLADSLEDHRRCLAFWMDQRRAAGEPRVLPMLTSNQVPDLYALWDIERRSAAPQPAVACASAIDPGSPPEAVSFLLELDEEGLASQEWRRIRRRRFPAPAEALAAARFEDDRGRPDLAIRVLWSSFQGLGSVSMADHPENVVRAYLPLRWAEPLKRAAREAGVDPWLLAGLARQESIFNRTARSPAGAIGVVQLLPSTARSHARALGLGRHPDLMDPAVNLEIGARELARLIRRFGAIEPALAAYNAGETRARRWWRRWPDRQRFTEAVPIPETYTYIRRVRFLGEAYRLVWADEWAGADVRTGRVAPGS